MSLLYIGVHMQSKGFSLIEVLVVVAIVALISAIAIPGYLGYVERAKIHNSVDYISSFDKDIITYYDRHGTFPTIIFGNEQVAVGNPATLPEYLRGFVHNVYGEQVNSITCDAGAYYSYIGGYGGDDVWVTGSTGRGIFLHRLFIATPDGAIRYACIYYENEDGSLAGDRNLISNCEYTTVPSPELEALLDSC